MKKAIWIILTGILFYLGCTKTAPEFIPDDGGQVNCTPQFPDMNVTYNNYVHGIVTRYCTESCHKGGNSPGIGDFRTYDGIKPYAGDLFYYRVVQDLADMPQGNAPLPKAIRDSLNVWIKNCSPEN